VVGLGCGYESGIRRRVRQPEKIDADPSDIAQPKSGSWRTCSRAKYALHDALMPEIKRFSGFKLLMFFQDENPPLE
jgi:hypothetical protein